MLAPTTINIMANASKVTPSRPAMVNRFCKLAIVMAAELSDGGVVCGLDICPTSETSLRPDGIITPRAIMRTMRPNPAPA